MMSEATIVQKDRRYVEKSLRLLDDESNCVYAARGKAAAVVDICCKDKGHDMLVKVCYQSISRAELNALLCFNEAQQAGSTILAIHIWTDYIQRPLRWKLFYGQPSQAIPEGLKKYVK
jgi:hypothetical protein